MQRTLIFKLLIFLFTCILSIRSQGCSCATGNVLQCSVSSSSSLVNTAACNSFNYNSINITYTGNAILTLTSLSPKPIAIKPADGSDSHTLQISNIDSEATRIDIYIRLSSNQESKPLFSASSYVVPSTSSLSINVIQSISNTNNFKIFDNSAISNINLANYEIFFENSSNSGTLNFHNLIRGLHAVSSLSIVGSSHILTTDSSQMPSSISINRLSLNNLRLYDQLLYNVLSLTEYSIEQCTYNRSAQFLNSDRPYTLSLIMKYNNPINSVLPNDPSTFDELGTVSSITLIEPKLSSYCLRSISKALKTDNLFLQVGNYDISDFITWQNYRALVKTLTINDIKDMNIFPSRFFSRLDAIQQVILQGTYTLKKDHICPFVDINTYNTQKPQLVILNSNQMNTNDWTIWNNCADTYVKAVNQRTIDNIKCLPNDTCDDCSRWANETEQCDLITRENTCSGQILSYGKNFRYNNSQLFLFFQKRLWLNQTIYPTRAPITKQDPLNIGAIIGAVIGLVLAIIILATTIFCIYRYRNKNLPKNNNILAPQAKYMPSSDDAEHLSIATSKTSQSSRYQLQKSFFPIQPNDEIAPPLYTAPSESVGSISNYNKLPSAPAAPRDSISTHATTHVYETLDS